MGDWFTWKEFKDEVKGQRPLDKSRLIQGDDGTYLDRLIRRGVADLQFFIPVFRLGQETLYYPSDFVSEGHASRGVLPPGAALRDVWLFDVERGCRHPVSVFPWERRFELTRAKCSWLMPNGWIAIDPQAYTFYLWPEVKAGWLLSLFWDGQKDAWQDEEATPFTQDAAEAVADYVGGTIAKEIDRDIQAHLSYFRNDALNPGSYMVKRRNLYLTAKERGWVKSPGIANSIEQYICLMSQQQPCSTATATAPSTQQQQFYVSDGDPNGVINSGGTLPCQCWDRVNKITWVKDDGINSNTGWH